MKTATLTQTHAALTELGNATRHQLAEVLGVTPSRAHQRLAALLDEGGAVAISGARRCDPTIYTATPGWERACVCEGGVP